MSYPQTSPILDFTVIDTHNPLTLAIADTSFYPQGFNIVNPTIQVFPPGFAVATQLYSPNTIITFNSNTLGMTCVPTLQLLATLPDGIWKVQMTIAPPIDNFVEKTFLRTVEIQQKLGKAFLKTDLTACNADQERENMRVVDEITFYIQAAIAAANQCNEVLAMNLYRTANTMLDNFLRGRCRGTRNTLFC